MMSAGRQILVAGALIALAVNPAVLVAADPPRIYRGLFGPDPEAALTSHSVVELRVSTYEAHGQTPARAGEGIDDTSLHQGRFYSGITSGLSYRRKARSALFNAGMGNALRIDPVAGATLAEHSGYGSVELNASRRTVVRAAGGLLYTPFHQMIGLPITPDAGGTIGGDANVASNASTTFSGGTSIARQVGRRGLLTAGYDGRLTSLRSGQPGTMSQQAGASYTHELAKGLALRVGDGVRVLQAGATPRIVAQDIALGIDVNRALTESRRTTVTFTSGSSITSSESGQRFVATGAATLTHRMGRTWQSAFTFDRGLQVSELLPQPFVGNTTSFTMGGFLGRRGSMRLRGGYSFGDFDLNGASARYSSYIGEARAAVALGRHFQLYAEHSYYQHRFPRGIALPPGVPYTRVQHGTRFGLDIWAPLVGRL